MDVSYINPIIESTQDFFRTMLGCEAQRVQLGLTKPVPEPRHITALIGISGDIRGVVALMLPTETAVRIASAMLDTPLVIVDDTVRDAIAEVLNIIAGGAKARIPTRSGQPNTISLATIVNGSSLNVAYPSKSTWIEIVFKSPLGPFSIRLTIESTSPAIDENAACKWPISSHQS